MLVQTTTRSQVKDRFLQLRGQAFRRRFWSRLSGHSQSLLCLNANIQRRTPRARHHAGVQLVPLAQIRGSEGRCRDFDAQFRPLQAHTADRWVDLALAHERGEPIPPVELVQIGEIYYVRDGHHRISVAHSYGQIAIEAEVTVWDEENQRNPTQVTASKGETTMLPNPNLMLANQVIQERQEQARRFARQRQLLKAVDGQQPKRHWPWSFLWPRQKPASTGCPGELLPATK
ncbi:MAG: hypothetical protein DCC55_19645 [Chloroflexi bacterium]|nr:MAG: hypothetical protein DCC55_19645 [Chloroflexota bacterium]